MGETELEYITIGKILSPWGKRGQLKIEPTTDFPERFTSSSTVHIDRQPFIIEDVRWQKGRAIIKLNTIDTMEAAQKLRGRLVEIRASQVESLPEGQYYHFQIIGLEVRTTQGEVLGNITEILTAPSNDNYIVQGTRGEILIPAIEDVIKSIDLDKGCVIIEPLEGLLN